MNIVMNVNEELQECKKMSDRFLMVFIKLYFVP
jgi:hypothetical protein